MSQVLDGNFVNHFGKTKFEQWCEDVRTEAARCDVSFLIPDGEIEGSRESFDNEVTPLEFVEEQVAACQ